MNIESNRLSENNLSASLFTFCFHCCDDRFLSRNHNNICCYSLQGKNSTRRNIESALNLLTSVANCYCYVNVAVSQFSSTHARARIHSMGVRRGGRGQLPLPPGFWAKVYMSKSTFLKQLPAAVSTGASCNHKRLFYRPCSSKFPNSLALAREP